MTARTLSDEELKALRDGLERVDGIDVREEQTDGGKRQGNSLFGVYLWDHVDKRYGAFLWVNRSLAKSYVQWYHQDKRELCRRVWCDAVKNSSNTDGSELTAEVDVGLVLRLVGEYAEEYRAS